MSHPIPGHILEFCDFCSKEAEDMVDNVWGGNNAEKKISVKCCSRHLAEMDSDPAGFDKKYAERLDQLFAESL